MNRRQFLIGTWHRYVTYCGMYHKRIQIKLTNLATITMQTLLYFFKLFDVSSPWRTSCKRAQQTNCMHQLLSKWLAINMYQLVLKMVLVYLSSSKLHCCIKTRFKRQCTSGILRISSLDWRHAIIYFYFHTLGSKKDFMVPKLPPETS